jgi:hypothetical protein
VAQTTHYANVDLVLKADEDLSSLVAEFGQKVVVLNAAAPNARNEAILEIDHQGGPDAAINGFCDLIEKFSPDARTLWKSCSERTFDIGFNTGLEPWPYRATVDARTLERAAAAGVNLIISVYAYRSKGGQ